MARHRDLTGADAIHQANYHQNTDPGAVGAEKEWWDTSGTNPVLKRRNPANDGWLIIATAGAGAGAGVVINDATTATDKVWSSSKTNTAIGAAVTALVAAAPGALDTLDELAAALGDDANFASTVTASLASKAPLASPALTGTPTAPTAAGGTNTTQLATTAFVQAAVNSATGVLFSIPIQLGNGVDAITTGEPENVFWLDLGNYNITGWTISGDASGSIVVKVERATYAAFPTWTEIMASERPTLSTAQKNQITLGAAVSTTTKSAFRATVVSATTVKAVSITLAAVRV